MNRSPRSWRTYLGLTLASALVAHVTFDAVASGAAAIVTRPIHLLYAVIVLAALAAARAELFHRLPSERRRRAALFRTAMQHTGYAWLAATVGLQAILAAGTLRLEGDPSDGSHLVAAALSALVAIIAGTLVLRRVERRALELVAAWFAGREPDLPTFTLVAPYVETAAADERPYCLFRPNRPPPAFA